MTRRMALSALLIMRPDAHERYGGDTKLVRDTAAALNAAGARADIVHSDAPDPRGYDVAHVFNVGQPDVCARQLAACEAAGTPIALSPVWLDLEEYAGRGLAQHRLFERTRDPRSIERTLRRFLDEKLHVDFFSGLLKKHSMRVFSTPSRSRSG